MLHHTALQHEAKSTPWTECYHCWLYKRLCLLDIPDLLEKTPPRWCNTTLANDRLLLGPEREQPTCHKTPEILHNDRGNPLSMLPRGFGGNQEPPSIQRWVKSGCQEIKKRDFQSSAGAASAGRRGSLPVRENTAEKPR